MLTATTHCAATDFPTVITQVSGGHGTRAQEQPQDQFLVAYAKIIDDKEDGIYMQDVYYGGVATNAKDAEQIARDCTSSGKGGIIIPKIFKMLEGDSILGALQTASARFRTIESQMINAEEVYDRTYKH
jgi:hypothetical protein